MYGCCGLSSWLSCFKTWAGIGDGVVERTGWGLWSGLVRIQLNVHILKFDVKLFQKIILNKRDEHYV